MAIAIFASHYSCGWLFSSAQSRSGISKRMVSVGGAWRDHCSCHNCKAVSEHYAETSQNVMRRAM